MQSAIEKQKVIKSSLSMIFFFNLNFILFYFQCRTADSQEHCGTHSLPSVHNPAHHHRVCYRNHRSRHQCRWTHSSSVPGFTDHHGVLHTGDNAQAVLQRVGILTDIYLNTCITFTALLRKLAFDRRCMYIVTGFLTKITAWPARLVGCAIPTGI